MLLRSVPVPFSLLAAPSQGRAATEFVGAYLSQSLAVYNETIALARFSGVPQVRLSYVCAHMRDSEFYERTALFYLTVDSRALWEHLVSEPRAPAHKTVLGVHSAVGNFGAGLVEAEYAFVLPEETRGD